LAGGAVIAAAALAIFLAERRWPLRKPTESATRRAACNVAMGVMSMAVVALVQTPLTTSLAKAVDQRRAASSACPYTRGRGMCWPSC
jgi:multisubunit Na+/H+ antiporter MnhB subunit